MDDIVPGALQRLRAADIIRVAGLAVASLGQEYCRIGAVQATMRRGAQLLGIVDMSNVDNVSTASPTTNVEAAEQAALEQHRYTVDVEIQSASAWIANCSCHARTPSICQHAAALLYQWLAHPTTFVTSPPHAIKSEKSMPLPAEQKPAFKSAHQAGQIRHIPSVRGPIPSAAFIDILTGMGLSELRGIAREYDINIAGLNKQQLADAIAGMLSQLEVVRRVAGGLEKPQRQLLATLTLVGGSITDEDLRSLFERFSFGEPDKLQGILLALQGKGLLFRTSLNSSPQQRIGLSGSLFDVGWYVPSEVRAALHVPVPITPFNIQAEADGETGTLEIRRVEPYSLLADLLLVARALDGYRLDHDDGKEERGGTVRSSLHSSGPLSSDGTGGIAPPGGLPSSLLIKIVQAAVPRTPAFLRYAVRLLRLADILHKDDTGTPYLRLLPNAARLLLGSTRAEVAHDLFELWLTQPGYDELFELQEENLRLRCRTTPLNHPLLRPGELEAENSEARQLLVAMIAQAPIDQWISFPAFARFIYRLNPSFLQKRQRLFPSPHWWLEQEEGRPLQPAQMSDWMRAEGHYLARLLRGPLHWWGITDLALSSDGRLLAFRLTPMADLLLKSRSDSAPGEEEGKQNYEHPSSVLNVLETGELLIACTPAAWPLIELIEDFAKAAGVRNDRLCYWLAPSSLAEALGRGQCPSALLKLLQQFAEDETRTQPDTSLLRLLSQLEHWTTSYGRVRLYTDVSLLEVADTLVMRELQATTSVEEQVVQSISPTLMILKKQGTERVVEEIKRRGQVPLLHEKDVYGEE